MVGSCGTRNDVPCTAPGYRQMSDLMASPSSPPASGRVPAGAPHRVPERARSRSGGRPPGPSPAFPASGGTTRARSTGGCSGTLPRPQRPRCGAGPPTCRGARRPSGNAPRRPSPARGSSVSAAWSGPVIAVGTRTLQPRGQGMQGLAWNALLATGLRQVCRRRVLSGSPPDCVPSNPSSHGAGRHRVLHRSAAPGPR